MGYKIDDFKLDLRKSTAPPNHIWVNSGYSTCSFIPNTVMGVEGCFSPPFAAKDTGLLFEIEANNHVVPDTGSRGKNDCGLLFSGAEWQPDKITRRGTYHYVIDEKLLSLSVVSELVPLSGKAGFLIRIVIRNRTKGDVNIRITPLLKAGHPSLFPLCSWEFMPPAISGHAAEEIMENVWQNDEVRITLVNDHHSTGILLENEIFECRFAVVFTKSEMAAEEPCNLDAWQRETREVWRKRIERDDTIPELRSNIPGLEGYYLRSLISGLVCLWENDDYVVSPFPATSGMDGGSICCYPWDVAGYSAETLVMLLGEKTLDFIKLMLESGIDKHISMSLDGGGLGWCSYSYSMWSVVNLYWAAVTQIGKGFELLDDIIRSFQAEEARLEEWENLKDYGRQHNLLEMRSCGYEYFVPSPNAERAWCYDRLADIAEFLGREDFGKWHEKADAIRKSIQVNLWDTAKGWFKCIHPHGHIETVYSIQAYDALRMGACNETMKNAMLKHLSEGAFLGKYGVSSISAEDELHYELNDPDWSGGGSYSGDGPNLAETLWRSREPQLAWDVLKRHFWMGEMLPYFPQEHYCDSPSVPVNKRANIIAGVAGLQAILYGMAGIRQGLDGSLTIDPQPPDEGEIKISGLLFKNKRINLIMKPNFAQIYVDGNLLYEGDPREIIIRMTG